MQQLNLLDQNSKHFCCGTTCDRKNAQEQIDRMQRIINVANEFFTWHNFPEEQIKHMVDELKELSTE